MAPVDAGGDRLLDGGRGGDIEGQELEPGKRTGVRDDPRQFQARRQQAERRYVSPLGRVVHLDHDDRGQQPVAAAERHHGRVIEDDHLRLPTCRAAMA
ncbi:hypothetical protein ACFY8W_22255 [Streptomyces sp. NPDC012637]|uniref:hypothetical protein n=1 Tax=Streptomyces sp. NPDC012637 TaxID=3364842 RepID=UPI0036EA263C